MKRLLIRMTVPPYAGLTASDALDFAFAAVNFGHQPVLLFEGRGVLQLLQEQIVPVGMRHHGKRLGACEMFDIEELYVSTSSLLELGVTQHQLISVVSVVDDKHIQDVISQCDHQVNF